MTRRPLCSDVLGGHRKCVRDPNHEGNHSDGERFWRFEGEPEPFVAEWLARARKGLTELGRDETGGVLR